MSAPSIEHHGVKGMKWGVRRYQNADGTLTTAGKTRYSAAREYRNVAKTNKAVEDIVKSLSDKERKLLGGKPGTAYLPDDEFETVVKRFVKSVGKTPVAFLDVYYTSTTAGSIALATRSDHRGKGYAGDLVKKAQDWLDTKEAKEALNIDTLNWFARRENTPSVALAKKYGFKERSDYKDDKEWYGRAIQAKMILVKMEVNSASVWSLLDHSFLTSPVYSLSFSQTGRLQTDAELTTSLALAQNRKYHTQYNGGMKYSKS